MCSGVSTRTAARGGSEMLPPTGDTACSFSIQSRSDANCFKVTAPLSKTRQGKKISWAIKSYFKQKKEKEKFLKMNI
jgi:hypothetical protein